MSIFTASGFDEFYRQLDQLIDYNEKDAAALKCFARDIFSGFPLRELDGRNLSDIYGCLFGLWQSLKSHRHDAPRVCVYNPTIEEHGWVCPHTVVTVLQRDMPFLVNSVRLELNRKGITIHNIKSSVLQVERTAEGLSHCCAVTDGGADCDGSETQQEALVYLEINLHASESDCRALAADLEKVLAEVALVVDSYSAMSEVLQASEQNIQAALQHRDEHAWEENIQFLMWLKNHFTLLGTLEYDLGKDGELLEKPGSRQGLYLEPETSELRSRLEADRISGVRAGPAPITFAKSLLQSRVHRGTYCDCIIVKRYNERHEVCGEVHFLGLYTSRVYTSSPTQIPLIRGKINHVMEASGIARTTHDGKALASLLETFPRDELFLCDSDELGHTVLGVLQMQERHRVRIFLRHDPFDRFISAVLYVPKDMFSTRSRELLQDIVGAEVGARASESTTYFSESVLARVYLVFELDPERRCEVDIARLESTLIDASRSWEDRLQQALFSSRGEEQGCRWFDAFGNGFPQSYKEHFEPRLAVVDLAAIDELGQDPDIGLSFYQPVGSKSNSVRLKVMRRQRSIELSDVIPVLEHLGLRVVGEHPYSIKQNDGAIIWLHDFNLELQLPGEIDVAGVRDTFQAAFAGECYCPAQASSQFHDAHHCLQRR